MCVPFYEGPSSKAPSKCPLLSIWLELLHFLIAKAIISKENEMAGIDFNLWAGNRVTQSL